MNEQEIVDNFDHFKCFASKAIKTTKYNKKGDLIISCDDFYGKNADLNITIFTKDNEPFPYISFIRVNTDDINTEDLFKLQPIVRTK